MTVMGRFEVISTGRLSVSLVWGSPWIGGRREGGTGRERQRGEKEREMRGPLICMACITQMLGVICQPGPLLPGPGCSEGGKQLDTVLSLFTPLLTMEGHANTIPSAPHPPFSLSLPPPPVRPRCPALCLRPGHNDRPAGRHRWGRGDWGGGGVTTGPPGSPSALVHILK